MDARAGRRDHWRIRMATTESIIIGLDPPAGTQLLPGSPVSLLTHAGPLAFVPLEFSQEALEQRVQRWVDSSLSPTITRLHQHPHYFAVMIQQLARLDRRLIEDDMAYDAVPHDLKRSQAETAKSFEHLAISSLWVLGGFQLVYTMQKQIQRRGAAFVGIKGRVQTVKNEFNRLREPFAKGRPNRGDFPSPFHGVRAGGSVAWAVSTQKLVSRFELSEQLLSLLETVARFTPRDAP
jgi:hypothetical protein